jgi:flagellar hook-basal body complex protein FliE
MINSGKNYYTLAKKAYNHASQYIGHLSKNSQKVTNSSNESSYSLGNIDKVSLTNNSSTSPSSNISNFASKIGQVQPPLNSTQNTNNLMQNPVKPSFNNNYFPETDNISANSIFPKILRKKIDQIRSAEAYALAESKGNASLVQVVKGVNEAEMQLTQLINVRDKLVNCLLEIFKMPL